MKHNSTNHRTARGRIARWLALGMLAAIAVPASAQANPCLHSGGHDSCKVPDLAIEKSGPTSIVFGGTATYTVTVRNVGEVTVQRSAVHVTDPAASPMELRFFRVVSGDTDTRLEPGEAWEYRLAGEVLRPVTLIANTCGKLVNMAKVAGVTGEKNLRNNVAYVKTGVICTRDLAIAKVADPTTATPGGLITYTVTVTNTGQLPIPFAEIAVSDPSLPGLTLVGTAPTTLNPGEVLTYRGQRTATVEDCGVVANTVTVAYTGEGDESTMTNNTAAATVDVACTTDLGITKTASLTTAAPGQTVTYTVVVTNTGQLALPFSRISVTDPSVANLAVVGTPPVTLASGATVTYTGTRTLGVADCGPVVNTATVTLLPPPEARIVVAPLPRKSATVTVTVAGDACNPPAVDAVLALEKLGPTVAKARRAYLVTLTVRNTGPVVARNVTISDPVPSGLAVWKAPAPATIDNGVVRWQVGDLGPGEARTVRLAVISVFRGTASRCNVATADADNAAPVRDALCTRYTRVAGQAFVPVTG